MILSQIIVVTFEIIVAVIIVYLFYRKYKRYKFLKEEGYKKEEERVKTQIIYAIWALLLPFVLLFVSLCLKELSTYIFNYIDMSFNMLEKLSSDKYKWDSTPIMITLFNIFLTWSFYKTLVNFYDNKKNKED